MPGKAALLVSGAGRVPGCRQVPTEAFPGLLPARRRSSSKVFFKPRRRWPLCGRIYYWRSIMNNDRIEGNWKSVKGKVKEQWGKLTDDDLDVIAGKRDQLLGRIQQRHGVAKDEAERQIDTFERSNPDYRFER
jgi:uncharacterized protein YjbJ (UPF0337 family)